MTDSLPPQRQAALCWPKASVALLSAAIIGLLLWHLFPQTGTPSTEDREGYDKALSAYQEADQDLGLAAGQALLVLRTAQERSETDPTVPQEEIAELHALLEVEPPQYDAPEVAPLTQENLRTEQAQLIEITDALATLTHKLSRQAAKVEKIVEQSPGVH